MTFILNNKSASHRLSLDTENVGPDNIPLIEKYRITLIKAFLYSTASLTILSASLLFTAVVSKKSSEKGKTKKIF